MARNRYLPSQGCTLATVIVGLFLGLHVLLALRHPASAWGLDMLAYLPASVHGVFVLLSVLLLLPSARQRLIDTLSRCSRAIDPWESRRSSVLFAGLLLLVAVAAFVLFRSATHLLGDGYLYLRELGRSVWRSGPRTGRAPLSFWIINTLHESGGRLWHSADLTYRIYSSVSGAIYHSQRRYSDAIVEFGKAVELEPGYAEGHYNLGVARYQLEDYPEAIRHFERAAALEPGDANAFASMALCYRRIGNTQKAGECYGRVLGLDPSYPGADDIRKWLRSNP